MAKYRIIETRESQYRPFDVQKYSPGFLFDLVGGYWYNVTSFQTLEEAVSWILDRTEPKVVWPYGT